MAFRSGLEQEVSRKLGKFLYEPFSAKYWQPKSYTPDFVHPENQNVWYEVKGFFRSHDEAKKYIHIRDSNPNIELRFIVSNPNIKAYPKVKIKMGEWLTKHGFKWCTKDNIPESWLRGE